MLGIWAKRMLKEMRAAESPTEYARSKLRIRNKLTRNLLSEFYGIIVYVFLGVAVGVQSALGKPPLNTYFSVNIGCGLALMLCVLQLSKTSGGHLNPAVSLMLWSLGKIGFVHFILYSIVQTIGAMIGAALVYAVYLEQFNHYAGDLRTITGENATAHAFTSFPPLHLSHVTLFFDQVAGTGMMCLFVAVTIDRRMGIPNYVQCMLFGANLMLIGMSYGLNEGYPVNPAKDFGQRIFAWWIYGSDVFSYHNYFFWINIVAPMIGAVAGAWLYHLCVGIHIPDECEENESQGTASSSTLLVAPKTQPNLQIEVSTARPARNLEQIG